MLTEIQKAKVVEWITDAQATLRLDQYCITVKWKKECGDKPEAIMACDPDNTYLNAQISVYEEKLAEEWKEFGEKCVRETCYHEVLHIIFGEISDLAEKRFCTESELATAEERIVENLSRVIVSLKDTIDNRSYNALPKPAPTPVIKAAADAAMVS